MKWEEKQEKGKNLGKSSGEWQKIYLCQLADRVKKKKSNKKITFLHNETCHWVKRETFSKDETQGEIYSIL